MTERDKLASEQAQLLRTLLAGEPVPPGFDAQQVAVEVRALRNKRRQVTAYLRPDLRTALGAERFAELFTEYAIAFPRRESVRARQDASYFANWLIARGDLPRPRPTVLQRILQTLGRPR